MVCAFKITKVFQPKVKYDMFGIGDNKDNNYTSTWNITSNLLGLST